MHLRAARCDARPPVLASRSDQLPQSVDLSGRGRAAAGIAGVPFRAAAERHARHWPSGKRGPIVRALRASGQALSNLPSTARLRAGHGRAARSGAGSLPRSSRRRASCRVTSRQSPSRARPTGGCWPVLRRRASWSTRLSISSQFRGRTGPFLEPASGPPSLDLRRVVRPELLVELLPAIRQARETGLPVRRDALRLEDEREVSVEVVPLADPNGAQCLLILLDDGSPPPKRRLSAGVSTTRCPSPRRTAGSPSCSTRSKTCVTTCVPRSKSTELSRRSSSRRTKRCSPRTKSTRARTKSWRLQRRNCSRPTRSSRRRSRSCGTGTAISARSMSSWSKRVRRRSAPWRMPTPSSRPCAFRWRSSIRRRGSSG